MYRKKNLNKATTSEMYKKNIQRFNTQNQLLFRIVIKTSKYLKKSYIKHQYQIGKVLIKSPYEMDLNNNKYSTHG